MYEPAVGGDNLWSGSQPQKAASHTHHSGLGQHTHTLGLVRIQTAVPSEAEELRPGELSADRRRGFVYNGAARLLMNSVCPDLESILLGWLRAGLGVGQVDGGKRGGLGCCVGSEKEGREDP